MSDSVMLVKVSAIANNNKFYELTRLPNGDVQARWGRVGASGQSQVYPGHLFDAKRREKLAKGYVEFSNSSAGSSNGSASAEARGHGVEPRIATALFGKAVNASVTRLVTGLVRNNRHAITDATGGKVTVAKSGQVTTALGPVTAVRLAEARALLTSMKSEDTSGSVSLSSREKYLTLIPQPVRRVADDSWINPSWFRRQDDLLDALDTAVAMSSATSSDDADDAPAPIPFRHTLVEVAVDSDEFKELEKRFSDSVNSGHMTSRHKLARAWAITDIERDAWDKAKKELRHHRVLWHGTTAGNVLSILRTGLICPPSSDRRYATTGRMFGDGVYFSDQSTKSLNYAAGQWSRDTGSGNPMMFLADVVMGREYRPGAGSSGVAHAARTQKDDKGRPYNSIFVRGGTGGVRNNEMIVWNTDQIRLTHLCEFKA